MIRKLKILVILVAVLSCKKENSTYSQQKERELFEAANDTTAGKEIREKKLDTLFHLLEQQKNDSINRNVLFKVAGLYYKLEQHEKYLTTTEKILQLAAKSRDTAQLAKSLYFIGDYYENELQVDSAFKYYSQAEKLYRTINDTLNSGRTTLYKAGVLYDAGIFTESEIQTTHALEYLINTKDDRLIYESYNLMALNLKELNNHKASLKYFNLALNQLDILERRNYNPGKLLRSRASIYNNMGNLYDKIENYAEAIKLYQKGLNSKAIRQDNAKLYAMLLNNSASSKLKAGNYNTNIEAALLQALKIRQDNDIEAGIISSKITLGEFYLYKKNTSKALEYLKQGYELAQKTNSSYDSKNALKLLSENDNNNKEYYNRLYQKISDSLYNLERNTRNKFARIAYETNQIEKKNAFLSKRNTNITIGAVGTIFIVGTLFIIYRLRTRNKELLFIKKQKEANEKIYQLILGQRSEADRIRIEERNRIAMELHDGIVNRIFTTRFNLMQLQPEQKERKEELVQELIAAETEIRKVSHDLQQNLLFDDDSFQKTLSTLIQNQQNEFNTKFDLSIDKYIDWTLIPSENKIHIYRIIQEAVQNINKYAHAKNADIMLLRTGEKITIHIQDNGIGFDPEKKGGIGLKNIKQRTSALKGMLTIVSNKEDGTLLKIVF